MPGDYGRRGRARRRRIDAARLAAARFFLCGRCRAQVLICSHCDSLPGQPYARRTQSYFAEFTRILIAIYTAHLYRIGASDAVP
jgi:hypothetical protein